MNFSTEFGSGSSNGTVFTDVFTVAGLTVSIYIYQLKDVCNVLRIILKVTNQTLGSVTSYSDQLNITNFAGDGLGGMGFAPLSALSPNSTPFFQNMVNQGVVDSPVFAFKLNATGAELAIGTIDTNDFTGQLTYVNVSIPVCSLCRRF